MKTCPTCGNQYGDEMKYCQIDGTPLNVPPVDDDPYKTVVRGSNNPLVNQTDNYDPNKTIISGGNQTMAGVPFDTGYNAPTDTPPPSPFGSSPSGSDYPPSPMNPSFGDLSGGAFNNPNQPLPSEQNPSSSNFARQTRGFDDPRSTGHFGSAPFDNQAQINQPHNQWTPPPAPNANWEKQGINQNTPFSPPQFQNTGGLNQSLATVSLVCGIAGILLSCCYLGIPLGIAALVTGFFARQNISQSPQVYTGNKLAVAGMITGVAAVLITIFLIIGNFLIK